MHDKNIYAIVYSKQQNCLITAGEDSTIQLYYLSGDVPTYNDVPLPTCFLVRSNCCSAPVHKSSAV